MPPTLLTRLRWATGETPHTDESAAVLARSFAYLYGAGATLVLATLALPHEVRAPAGIVAAAVAAYVVVALLLVGFDRLPPGFFRAMPPSGTVLVSVVVMAGGADAVAAYGTIYFWVVLSAHYFFSWREGAANTAAVAVAYAVVLAATPAVRSPEVKWLALTATLAVAGLLVSLLRARVAAQTSRLRHQAYHDDLTGLPNRLFLVERLEAALGDARSRGTATGVLHLDVDDFQVINDGLGHAAGDAMLVALVPRLRESLPPGATLARFGGDEFVILCEGLGSPGEALDVAADLRRALERPVAAGGAVRRVTAGIGVAAARPGDRDGRALVRNADAALSRAKAGGRDRIAVYDSEMRDDALARLELENALRGALDGGELRLVYQPVIEIETGRIVACEALLRWRHPGLAEVSPAQMIPVAEDTGMIVPIGRWVLGEACAEAARWRRLVSGCGPKVTVNVSARQLSDPGFAQDVEDALATSGLRPRDLVLELTESALIEEGTGAAGCLERIRALGVRVALDDFGTGYSSLSYLRQLPVDTVKLDRSFVATMDDGTGGDALVVSVLGLADGLGLHSVAEGIETPDQLDRLRDMGCRLGQGFLLARPMAPEDLDALLVSGDGTLAARESPSAV